MTVAAGALLRRGVELIFVNRHVAEGAEIGILSLIKIELMHDFWWFSR